MNKKLTIDFEAYKALELEIPQFSVIKAKLTESISIAIANEAITPELGVYLNECETLEEVHQTLISLLEENYDITLDWLYSITNPSTQMIIL